MSGAQGKIAQRNSRFAEKFSHTFFHAPIKHGPQKYEIVARPSFGARRASFVRLCQLLKFCGQL
jgi:hypothetical protein